MAHINLCDHSVFAPLETELQWEDFKRGILRLLNLNCSNWVQDGFLERTTERMRWVNGICEYDSLSILPYLDKYNFIEVLASPGYKFNFAKHAATSPHNARLVEEKRIHVYFKYTSYGVYISAKITPDLFSYMLRVFPEVRDALGIFFGSPAPRSGAAPTQQTFRFFVPGYRLNAFNFTAYSHPVDENIPPFIKFIRPAESPDDLAGFLHVIFGLPDNLENSSHWGGDSSLSLLSDEDLPYTSQPHNLWYKANFIGLELQ
jgi:hypothetical protein